MREQLLLLVLLVGQCPLLGLVPLLGPAPLLLLLDCLPGVEDPWPCLCLWVEGLYPCRWAQAQLLQLQVHLLRALVLARPLLVALPLLLETPLPLAVGPSPYLCPWVEGLCLWPGRVQPRLLLLASRLLLGPPLSLVQLLPLEPPILEQPLPLEELDLLVVCLSTNQASRLQMTGAQSQTLSNYRRLNSLLGLPLPLEPLLPPAQSLSLESPLRMPRQHRVGLSPLLKPALTLEEHQQHLLPYPCP